MNNYAVGDTVEYLAKPGRMMRVVEVGHSEDNRGRLKPAVRAADLADLAAEERGDIDPVWGNRKFKASRYWYLLCEIRKVSQ